MLSTRRQFLQRSTQGLGGLAAIAMLPQTAHADELQNILNVFGGQNCSSGKQTAGFRQINGSSKVASFTDWREGDCELQGAQITLNTNGTGVFSAQVCTHFTHSKDIWHFYVELGKDANSALHYTSYKWDGPKMSEQDHPLFHTWTVNFKVAPDAVSLIQYARATSCC